MNPPNMTERFMIRVTPAQRKEYDALALAQRRSLSDWARIAIEASLGRATPS